MNTPNEGELIMLVIMGTFFALFVLSGYLKDKAGRNGR